MSNLNIDLGVIEHRMHQAHRSAVQAELNAAGLGEIGHPLLLCILRSAQEHGGEGRVQAQRELAQILNFPRSGDYIPEIIGKTGLYRPPARAGGRPVQPGAADRKGAEGGGRLLRLPAAGHPQDVRRL